MKLKISRNKIIILCVTLIFGFMTLFSALSIDANYIMFKEKNPIALLAKAIGFNEIKPVSQMWVMLTFFVIWLIIFVFSICFVDSYARSKEESPYSTKYLFTYGVILLICLVLSFGISSLFYIPDNFDIYGLSLAFVFESILFGLLITVFLGLLCFVVVGLFINIKNYHKPLFNITENNSIAESKMEQSLATTFNTTENDKVLSTSSNVVSTISVGNNLKEKEELFKGLTKIDKAYLNSGNLNLDSTNLSLKEICSNLQIYLANTCSLYYDIANLRAFIAGLAASNLIILEGISGTGKSSLPRYFAKFIGEDAYFEAIQATYRDKSNLLGYYNEFTNTYMETDFLKSLYKASIYPNHLNFLVLDEMNISRVEYYFADFLSVLEYPEDERYIRIMEIPDGYDAPSNLKDGLLTITPNNYFIGTCNKDDSTYTLTDKVIDRAIVINFNEHEDKLDFNKKVDPIILTYQGLKELYINALNNNDYTLKENDLKNITNLLKQINDLFDIVIGNRIIKQLEIFIPVYRSCGGTIDEAIDFMFKNKILRKLEGHFESSLKQSLTKFKKYLLNDFSYKLNDTILLIDKYLNRLM